MKNNLIRGLFLSLIAVSSYTSLVQAQDEEGAGRSAEQAGRLSEAFNHYLAALRNVSAGSEADQRLREKIIAVVEGLKPAPGIPEEARRHFIKGDTLARDAHSPAEMTPAIEEYKQALLLAPWWASAYHDLGFVDEAAGLFDNARRDLQLFLLTKPTDAEARAAQDEIYKVEAKQQVAAKRAADEAAKAQRQAAEAALRAQQQAADAALRAQQKAAADAERLANMFVGRWYDGNDSEYLVQVTRTSGTYYVNPPSSSFTPHNENYSHARVSTAGTHYVSDVRVDGQRIGFTMHTEIQTSINDRQLTERLEDRYDLIISEDGRKLSGTKMIRGCVFCGTKAETNPSSSFQVEIYRRD